MSVVALFVAYCCFKLLAQSRGLTPGGISHVRHPPLDDTADLLCAFFLNARQDKKKLTYTRWLKLRGQGRCAHRLCTQHALAHHAYAAYRALMTCTGCAPFSPSWKGLQHSPYGLPEKHGQGAEAAGVLLVLIALLPWSLFAAGLFWSAPKPLASMTEPCCLRQRGACRRRVRENDAQGTWVKYIEGATKAFCVSQINLSFSRCIDCSTCGNS